MFDIVMLLLVLAGFLLAGAYARMCDRLLAYPLDKFRQDDPI